MSSEAPYRLRDLVELSHRILTADGEVRGDSRRVQWNPSERLFRYYTTLGLLDRPTELRGRTAWYGLRQLLQILAIKRLQSRGATLKEVQVALSARPDAELARLADLPDGWTAPAVAGPSPEVGAFQPEPARRKTASAVETDCLGSPRPFWERAPQMPLLQTEEARRGPVEVSLAPGIVLRLDDEFGRRTSAGGLLRACRPLLEYLASLVDHPEGGGEDDR